MLLRGHHNELILFMKPAGSMHWKIVCFGAKRHYRKDGTCAHTAAVLGAMRSDWHRARTRVSLFGGKP